MLEFIGKYWLEFFLGLIATALSVVCKKIYKLYKNEKQHQKTTEQKEFYRGLEELIQKGTEESRRGDEKLQQQINIIQSGILSLQGKLFKQECRDYLRPDREFSVEDFENLQEEYDTYKDLGGNHDGATLFELVEKKAAHILTDNK